MLLAGKCFNEMAIFRRKPCKNHQGRKSPLRRHFDGDLAIAVLPVAGGPCAKDCPSHKFISDSSAISEMNLPVRSTIRSLSLSSVAT